MFTLADLSSHLVDFKDIGSTADGEAFVETRRRSSGRSTISSAPRALSARSWQEQAGEAIATSSTPGFKSQAIAFEVRAAEALAECARRSTAGGTDPNAAPLPDALRTAVCCQRAPEVQVNGRTQLLGELGDACAPFARPLARIREELARAVFSPYHASDDGTLALKQLPYFAVVSRLETEKAHLLADRDALRLALRAKEEENAVLEDRVAEVMAMIQGARSEHEAAAQSAQRAQQTCSAAQTEAAAAREELKDARKDMLRLRQEDTSLRALHSVAKARGEQQAARIEELQAALDAVHAATADWRRARVASAVARDGRGMAGDEAAADEGDAEDGKGGGGS